MTAGSTIHIQYLYGLTTAFLNTPPSVDANGYQNGVGGPFGSGAGPGYTGIGASGNFFPSHAIDPTNTGPAINLAELLGDFVGSSGVVISAFAIGDSPLSIIAPNGAVSLQLGLNDDIYGDNSGALYVDVTSGVPEPASWAMMLAGFFGAGAILRRQKQPLAFS